MLEPGFSSAFALDVLCFCEDHPRLVRLKESALSLRTSLAYAALSTGLLVCNGVAADTGGHKLDRVTITGSRSVPPEQLYAALKEQKGEIVTHDDILADQSTILGMLAKANVGGSIKTSMITKSNGHIEVTFAITDQGVTAPTVTKVAPKLDHQVFTGNVKVTSADLEAVTGLKSGDDLTNAKLSTAQAAIVDLYKKAGKVNVLVSADPKTVGNGKVEIDWQIAETPPKEAPKKKKKDDEGGFSTE